MTAPVLDRPPAGLLPQRVAAELAEQSWRVAQQAAAGDQAAFAALYARYRPGVFRLVYRRTGSLDLAEDLTQDTFVRALGAIGRYVWRGRDVGAWLFTIAGNVVRSHYRLAEVRRCRPASLLPSAGPEFGEVIGPTLGGRPDDDPAVDPARAYARAELAAAIAAATCLLSADQRQLIQLRYLDELSLAETAEAMGRPYNAVVLLQRRAVRALAAHLPDSFRPETATSRGEGHR